MRKFLLILLLPFTALAAEKYYRQGASGAGTGNNWTDAYTSWATAYGAVNRGDTLWVADTSTSIGSIDLNKALSGSTPLTIKKATVASHGTSTGWSDSYGDGQAVFGSITVTTGYHIMDGQTRTETTRMEEPTGYGFRATDMNADSLLNQNASYSQISYVDLGGAWTASDSPVCSEGSYALRFVYNQTGMTFTRCIFHNCGVNNGALVTMHGSVDLTFDHCDFYMGWGKSTIGTPNAGNTRLTVKYCRFWNSSRRDTCPAAEGPGITCEIGSYSTTSDHVGHLIYGNIIYSTASGGRNGSIMYGEPALAGNAQNCKVYNNSFIGFPEASVLGDIYLKGGSGNEARNNLFYNTGSSSITANTISHNVTASSNPFVDYNNRDFRLAVPTSAGYVLDAPYNTDPAGNARGLDGTWDVGAYEYGGAQIPPNIISNNATGTNGVAFSYTIALEVAGTASAYGATGLPTGLSRSGAYITGTPTGYSSTTNITVTLFATNSALPPEYDSQAVIFTIYPATAIPAITSTLGFTLIPTNTTTDGTFVISNAVPGTILTGSVSNTAAPFSIVTSPATFAVSNTTTKTFTIRYSPTTAEIHSGTVAVSHSVGSNYVSLNGMAFPVTSGTNIFLTNALVVLPMVKSNTFVTVTNTQAGYPDTLTGLAIYGMNSTAAATGAWHGTFIATNVATGAAITVDAASSEHVENAATGETTPHTQGTLTDGYIVASVGIWSQTDADVTGVSYDGSAMQLLAAHNLDYYGEYRAQIYGLAVGSKASGTYDFVVTANGTLGHYNAGIVSLNNVLQTGSYGTAVDGVGTNTTASLTVSSAAGEMVFLAVVRGNSIGAPNSGETERVDTQPEADGESQFPDTLWVGTEPGAASVAIGVDFDSSQTYCATAIPIKASTNYGVNSVSIALNVSTNPWTWYVSGTNWDTIVGTNQVIIGTSNLIFVQVREPSTWMRELRFVPDSEFGADETAPTVTISTPTNGTVYATATTPLASLAGTSSDNVSVSTVTATNNSTGLIVTGTTSWSVSNIALVEGTNAITVYASDGVNTGSDSLTVIYTAPNTNAPVSKVTDLRVETLRVTQ